MDKRATYLAWGIFRSMNAIGRPAELDEPPFAWLRCVSFRTLTNCTALPELCGDLLQHSCIVCTVHTSICQEIPAFGRLTGLPFRKKYCLSPPDLPKAALSLEMYLRQSRSL